MKISENGIKIIQRFEGFRALPYKDQGGLSTIGYGHLIREGEHFLLPLTPESAVNIMLNDLAPVELSITDCVKVPLNQNQFDALCSFTYNVGISTLVYSPMLRILNTGKFDVAMEHWKLYDHVAGIVNDGLYKRRLAEIELFNTPIETEAA